MGVRVQLMLTSHGCQFPTETPARETLRKRPLGPDRVHATPQCSTPGRKPQSAAIRSKHLETPQASRTGFSQANPFQLPSFFATCYFAQACCLQDRELQDREQLTANSWVYECKKSCPNCGSQFPTETPARETLRERPFFASAGTQLPARVTPQTPRRVISLPANIYSVQTERTQHRIAALPVANHSRPLLAASIFKPHKRVAHGLFRNQNCFSFPLLFATCQRSGRPPPLHLGFPLGLRID
jgi:hypothetical protein